MNPKILQAGPGGCLAESALEKLAGGEIPEPGLSLCLGHVCDCPGCSDRLDTWVRRVEMARCRAVPTPGADEPVPVVFLERGTPDAPLPALDPPSGEGDIGAIGRYRVETVLGRGPMAVTWGAFEPELNRRVAIKMLEPDLAADPEVRSAFLHEARAMAAIHHDGIVPVHTVDKFRETPYFVMPLLEGESLQARLGRGRLPEALVERFTRQLAGALAAAHASGVVHRDVKPSNIWIRRRTGGGDDAVLLDFGIALPADAAGSGSGTPRVVENVVVTVRATDANGHTADIQVNIRDVAAFQPYLVSAGNGATTNRRILPQALINPTTYANGTAVAMYDGAESRARAQYVPFIGFRGEVRVALDDVNRDGRVDILAVPGPGAAPVIKMLDVQSGATVRTFLPFATTYRGGVFLTTGDVNNDGRRDIIASTGGGTQPRIVAFDGVSGARLLDFNPFERAFRAGVTVAVTDTDRNGINEIIVGSGVGDRALVRIFDSVSLAMVREFSPFGRNSRAGVNVAAGDIGGDGVNEIVAATMSAESRVTVWNARTLQMVDNFFAYGQNDGQTPFPGGVRVAIEDYNRDGRGDLITGAGVTGFPHVRVWALVRGKFRDVASYYATDASDLGGVHVG